jgi:hypothetical protein
MLLPYTSLSTACTAQQTCLLSLHAILVSCPCNHGWPPLAAEVKRPIIELCILAIITSSTSLPVVWCAFSLHCHNMPAQGRKVCMSALHVCRVVMQPTTFGLIYPTTSELVGIAWCLLRKTASAVQCCVRRLLLHCILHGCWSAAVGTILQCNTECELGSCDGTCPIACA